MNLSTLSAYYGGLGLGADRQSGNFYGIYGGYHVCVDTSNLNNGQLSYVFSVTCGGAEPDETLLRQTVKGIKRVRNVSVVGHRVTVLLSFGSFGGQKRLDESKAALDAIVGILRQSGCQDCCQDCGNVTETAACIVKGIPVHLCHDCYSRQAEAVGQAALAEQRKPENLAGSAVGALLGSLIGVLAIVVLEQLGYVAVISGIIMAVCTLKGCEMMGGKMTRNSVIISVIIMVVMVLVGDWIDWALVVSSAWELDFVTSFRLVPVLLVEDALEGYWSNLLWLYLFTAVGAVPSILSYRKKQIDDASVYVMN
ncbi:MAG: hypothetical protein LIO45_06965 [Clostridiales bacterium]|nr:hypothetical protein [Clostridiales bacterium]